MNNKELRYLPLEGWEIREEEGKPPILEGYGSVFNQEAIIYEGTPWAFREMFMPGSFKKTIRENDIISSWNHNFDLVLGRKKNGTLQLFEDDYGLRVIITPPDTQAGRDAITSIRRGDVTGMSIIFKPIKMDPVKLPESREELPLRKVREAKLFEVGPVAIPAYSTTSISARQGICLPGDEPDEFEKALAIIRRSQTLDIELTNEQRETIRAAVEMYKPYLLEPEHDQDGHHSSLPEPEPDSAPEGAAHWEPQPEESYSAEERERRLKELSDTLYPSSRR
jgi:uncharacterized protein